jgi:predicted phage terminase large subunit-like protein
MADQDIPLLDDTIVQLPSDLRQDMAERGKTDLYYLAKGILGYRDMTPRCHLPLCLFLDSNPSRFKLVLHPRGTFKTSVGTIGGAIQKIVRSTNNRILIANETSRNAERFAGSVKQHFESNRVLRALYSEIIPKNTRKVRWNNSELDFNRTWNGPEPTLDTLGMTGAMTSRHYTDLIVDDPISEEAAKSEAVMSDVITRIDKLHSLMVNAEEDNFLLIGTRWALFDVYSFFIKKFSGHLAKFIRSALVDGESIFPERLSVETLAQIRSTMGEYMFSCLYLNNPRDIANQDFNIDDLKFWRWSVDEEDVVLFDREGDVCAVWQLERLDINVSIDLAVSEKVSNDRNAIVVTGTSPAGDVIVLHTWTKRCTPLEVIEELFRIRRRFHPRAFGIEGVAYQKAFKYFLRAECELRGEYMNIVELKAIPSKRGTGNNSKEMRIRGLQPIAATGRLYVLPTQHDLRNEMADFPLGQFDDTLDALAHQLTMWRGLVSPKSVARRMEAEAATIAKIMAEQNSGYGRGEPFDPTFDELPRYGRFSEYTERGVY